MASAILEDAETALRVTKRKRSNDACAFSKKGACFVTGNYDRKASVMGMLQDLKWDTLETISGYARLSVMCKMCYGFLDKKWEDYLTPNRERRTQGSHNFKLITPKGHKSIFRFSFFRRTITEWNKSRKETVTSQALSVSKSKLF